MCIERKLHPKIRVKVYTFLTGREMPKKFGVFSALCPMIPDLDGLDIPDIEP